MYQNFRAGFEEHFPYTPEEILHVWKEAIIVLDTNVLLNFYRISTNTTDQMFDICNAAQDRLVIPHQVRVEFHRHREKTIAEQVGLFRSVIQDLESISSNFSNNHKRHPTIPLEDIASKLKELADDLVKQVRDVQTSQPINFISNPDTVLSKLESLLSGRCQGPFPETEMRQLEEFLSTRLEQSIPPCGVPGRDNDKSKPKEQSEHRGDGIVWWQTIQIVAAHKKPLIFVTSDQKANWWRTAKLGNDDRQIGPHTQLIKDVMEIGGSKLLVFTQTQFLEEAPKYLSQVKENAEAVKEVKELEASDRTVVEFHRAKEPVWMKDEYLTRADVRRLRNGLNAVMHCEAGKKHLSMLPSTARLRIEVALANLTNRQLRELKGPIIQFIQCENALKEIRGSKEVQQDELTAMKLALLNAGVNPNDISSDAIRNLRRMVSTQDAQRIIEEDIEKLVSSIILTLLALSDGVLGST